MMHNVIKERLTYLEENVFFGLINQNDGFTNINFQFFSKDDFYLVMERCTDLKLGICGIESWSEDEKVFIDVRVYENFKTFPFNPEWYFEAFSQLAKSDRKIIFFATFYVPTYDI